MSPQGAGTGKTPERVVELLRVEVKKTNQSATSRATGVNQAAIGRYIKGVGEPNTSTLEKLAKYFDKSVAWLRGEPGSIDFNLVRPLAVCAECGQELQVSPEGFVRILPDGTEDEGDGVYRIWPCDTCLAAARQEGRKLKKQQAPILK